MKNRLLLEDANTILPGANSLTVEDFLNWINHEFHGNKRKIYVKAIVPGFNTIQEIKGDFFWKPDQESAIMVYMPNAGHDQNDEKTLQEVFDDLTAISQEQNGVKLDIAKNTDGQNYDKNSCRSMGAIYIVNTNTIYLIPYTNKADTDILEHTLENAIRNEYISKCRRKFNSCIKNSRGCWIVCRIHGNSWKTLN